MPPIPVTGTFHQAKQLLDKKLTYLRTMLKKFRDKRYAVMKRNKEFHGYTSGQLAWSLSGLITGRHESSKESILSLGEPCKSTSGVAELCSPVFKEAQPRPSCSV